MNTNELRTALFENDVTSNYFLDVYAADQLPLTKIAIPQWLLIYNCCPIALPGMHWVAIFGKENGDVEFFDSFGLAPNMYSGVPEFLSRQRAKQVFYNSLQLQSTKSDACGHYCLFYGYFRCKGMDMEAILRCILEFDRDTWIKFKVLGQLYNRK